MDFISTDVLLQLPMGESLRITVPRCRAQKVASLVRSRLSHVDRFHFWRVRQWGNGVVATKIAPRKIGQRRSELKEN